MCEVLGKLGCKHAVVVNGSGLDEVTLTGKTKVAEYKDGHINTYDIKPTDFGMKLADLTEIQGNSPDENKDIILKILKGEEKGPKRDVVVLNAAVALFAAEKVPDIKDGITLANESIDSGKALEKLNKLVAFTNN